MAHERRWRRWSWKDCDDCLKTSRRGRGKQVIFLFLYTIGNVDFFLRFSPLMFLRKSKNKERQNKRAKGIKRQDRLGQLEINIWANAPTRANQPFCTLSCLVSAHSVVSYKMADMGENIPNGKGREKGYEQEKKGGWGERGGWTWW